MIVEYTSLMAGELVFLNGGEMDSLIMCRIMDLNETEMIGGQEEVTVNLNARNLR